MCPPAHQLCRSLCSLTLNRCCAGISGPLLFPPCSTDGTTGSKWCSAHLFHFLFPCRPHQPPNMCGLSLCTSAHMCLEGLAGGEGGCEGAAFCQSWGRWFCNLFATHQSLALVQTYLFKIHTFLPLSKDLQPQFTRRSSCSHSPNVSSVGQAKLR